MKTVIMAGGKGTRISSVAKDIPKPMIKIENKPVLEHEIDCLRDQGFKDIIITVSHLGHIIMDYFGDGSKVSPATGKPFGVNIEYFMEEVPLGNAGALFQLKDKLSEDFLLLNADSIFDIDFNRLVDYHHKKGGLVTLFTHPNNHPYDSGLIFTDDDGAVTSWLAKEDVRPDYYRNRVNAGLHVLNKKVLDVNIDTEKIDLDRQILKPLSGTGKMFAYDSSEYVKDMGTPERYEMVCIDFRDGKVKARNLTNKQKAIFLDRDGVINEYKGFITDINDFELIDGVPEAIKKINSSGYLAIVITNQPVIARGEVTFKELTDIHNKMETLLGKDGAYIDGLFFCPHHPDKGFDGEVVELKIDCDCRKPKTGLLERAKLQYNIDLERSWFIGDTTTDVLTGENASCRTVIVKTGMAGKDGKYDVKADIEADTLIEAVDAIINA